VFRVGVAVLPKAALREAITLHDKVVSQTVCGLVAVAVFLFLVVPGRRRRAVAR